MEKLNFFLIQIIFNIGLNSIVYLLIYSNLKLCNYDVTVCIIENIVPVLYLYIFT